MTSNIQFSNELSTAIPLASAAGKARLFRDIADNILKFKDHLGAVYPVAGTQDYKDAVRFATTVALPAYTRTGNIITANAFGTLPSQDGVTPAVNDSFLLINGASNVDNGIWTITQIGSGILPFVLERRGDFSVSAQVSPGCIVPTGPEGLDNGKKIFILASADPIVLNITPLLFEAISGGDGGGYTLAEIIEEKIIPERQDMVYVDDVVIGDDGDLVAEGNTTPGRTEDNFSILYVPTRSKRVVQENDQLLFTQNIIVDGTLVVDGDMVDVTPYDGFDIITALETTFPGQKYIDREIRTLSATPTTIYSYATAFDNRIIAFDLVVEAQSNNNTDIALFKIAAAVHRGSGATTVTIKDVNFVNGPYRDAGAVAWDVSFIAPGGGPDVLVQVAGDAGESIDWRVTGKIIEHG
jgi:hypothetical protein